MADFIEIPTDGTAGNVVSVMVSGLMTLGIKFITQVVVARQMHVLITVHGVVWLTVATILRL